MARPGVMLYFDMIDPIRVLPDADKGRLLMAILEYGQSGISPQLDGMLAMAWGFVKPKIDMDTQKYDNTILRRKYATFCRERKRSGESEVGFDVWLTTIYESDDQAVSHDKSDNQWYPTTTTTPTVTPTVTTTPTTTTTPTVTPTVTTTPTVTAAAAVTANACGDPAAAAAEKKGLKVLHGELGKGVVVLTDGQIDALLDKLGLDMFDRYVARLADYIISSGKTVKNHYATILKWWAEDSTC